MEKYFFQTVPLIRCVIPSCGVEQTDRMEPLMSQLYFHCISFVFPFMPLSCISKKTGQKRELCRR